ncbi:hypothetical protein [Pseudomonas gelidaquae]|nr:hypothetical protein [Pseudomonas sp. IB20]
MKPLQFNDLLINFTSEFLPLWSDKGSGAHKDVGLYTACYAWMTARYQTL